jgi:hypothetical protein
VREDTLGFRRARCVSVESALVLLRARVNDIISVALVVASRPRVPVYSENAPERRRADWTCSISAAEAVSTLRPLAGVTDWGPGRPYGAGERMLVARVSHDERASRRRKRR